ncbi:MAG TPA: hypothetical protein VER96_14480 [Polyangiaceae bacterium]|nr:hypothetical protein [Polyangiaceae bacterium]
MQLDAASRAVADLWKNERYRAHAAAALIAICAAVLMTWPLAANAGHQVLGAAYFWDAYTNAMLMGSRVDAALGRSALSLYDSYYFAPLTQSIVFNENQFGLSFLFAPFYLLGDNPLWAYNLTLLSSLALSVFFSYLLVLRLTGSPFAGVIAGVAFAFCPYVLFEIGRLQLVATQWIPATFLFLHRAIEGQRRRDIAGFWLCALLQLGTCLYYTMFMLPLLSLAGSVLLIRERPSRRFFLWFGAGAVLTVLIAFTMVRPYFAARHSFNLLRSESFASSYDGKLGFFSNVSETNRTLTGMHYQDTQPGAHEEIAFPGFTVLVFALVALALPAFRALRRVGPKRALVTLVLWLALALLAACYTWVERSLLAGALIFGAGAVAWSLARRLVPQPFGGRVGLYFALFLLAVALFLGLNASPSPGPAIRGLYYYLYTYIPGFNGIRKVSRQAVMTTFIACILAGFGASRVFAELRRAWLRVVFAALLLGALCYELRCYPHPIERVWGSDDVPSVVRAAAALPARDLLASIPQNEGRWPFGGDAGMALHNYLALYHRHRFVTGQSSYEPAVTTLALNALQRLPDEAARRTLLAIGTRHLIIYGDELERERAGLVAQLAARPAEYRSVFQHGPNSLFSLLGADDPTLQPLETPALPAFARLIPHSEMRVTASPSEDIASLAVDDRRDTFWTTGRDQEPGQYFEVELGSPQPIVALEIDDPGRVMDAPASYRIVAQRGTQDLGVVAEVQKIRFFHAQIFSPETFVFRVVFSRPILADRLRLIVEQPVPGFYFAIHELRVFAAAAPGTTHP